MKSNNHRIIKTALAIIILGILALGGWAAYQQYSLYLAEESKLEALPEEGIIARVLRVVDGDTITVDIDGYADTVRLIGIDAPEIGGKAVPPECFGLEAKEKMQTLVLDEDVGLVPDKSQAGRDKYERLLAYVYLNDGMLVNQEMIREGFALEYKHDLPYKMESKFKSAEMTSRNLGIGLWSEKNCPRP